MTTVAKIPASARLCPPSLAFTLGTLMMPAAPPAMTTRSDDPPVDKPRPGITGGGGEPEGGDGEQGGADGTWQRHAGPEHKAGHDEEAAADAEEARQQTLPRRRPQAGGATYSPHGLLAVQADVFAGAPVRRVHLIGEADADHEQAEQRKQRGAIERLAERGADRAPSHPGRRESNAHGHFTVPRRAWARGRRQR